MSRILLVVMYCSCIQDDEVNFGISEEYAQSVLDSAIDLISKIGGFPSGKLIFNIGANARCGSSRTVFAQATKALIMLSNLDLENISNEVLQQKIENII